LAYAQFLEISLTSQVQVSTGVGVGLNVRSSAHGTRIGSQPHGATGIVIGGPITTAGHTWWEVDFDLSPDGWVAEGFLVATSVNFIPTPLPENTCKDGYLDTIARPDTGALGKDFESIPNGVTRYYCARVPDGPSPIGIRFEADPSLDKGCSRAIMTVKQQNGRQWVKSSSIAGSPQVNVLAQTRDGSYDPQETAPGIYYIEITGLTDECPHYDVLWLYGDPIPSQFSLLPTPAVVHAPSSTESFQQPTTCSIAAEVYDTQFGGCWQGVIIGPGCFVKFPSIPEGWTAPPDCANGVTFDQPKFTGVPKIWVPSPVVPPPLLPPPSPEPTPSGTELGLTSQVQVNTGVGVGLNVRSSAHGTRIGSQPHGATGIVIGGPITTAGHTWWEVDFDLSPDGWVAEGFLKLVTSDTPVENCVELNTPDGKPYNVKTKVHSPGGPSFQGELGFQSNGSRGEIADGPYIYQGQEWVGVNFKQLRDGYVPRSNLISCAGPDPFIDPPLTDVERGIMNKSTDIQTTIEPTLLHGTPDGPIIAHERKGAVGTVIDDPSDPLGGLGPVTNSFKTVNGVAWYYIQFRSGDGGWVRRDHIRQKLPDYACETNGDSQGYINFTTKYDRADPSIGEDSYYTYSFYNTWTKSVEIYPGKKYELCIPIREPYVPKDMDLNTINISIRNVPDFECSTVRSQLLQTFAPFAQSQIEGGDGPSPELENRAYRTFTEEACPGCVKRGMYKLNLEGTGRDYDADPNPYSLNFNDCNLFWIDWTIKSTKNPEWATEGPLPLPPNPWLPQGASVIDAWLPEHARALDELKLRLEILRERLSEIR
jgi:hypothetical protein